MRGFGSSAPCYGAAVTLLRLFDAKEYIIKEKEDHIMSLMGKIKEKTAKTEGLGKAGIRLTNEDLVSVAGGGGIATVRII